MDQDDLLDILSDLAHDLGKYLARPLAWLPADADADAVRAAAEEALFATQRRGDARTSAEALWRAFLAEVGELPETPAAEALAASVARALGWSRRLDALDRTAAQADFAAVQPAIRALMDEVKHG